MVEMIPTVQERKKNVHVFMNSYPYICRLQNTVPNPNIKIDSSNYCLDFVGDRLKLDDWKPVLEALSHDKSLHFIKIRSRHSKHKVLQEAETESQARQISTPKASPLFTTYILVKLSESLSKCLSNSAVLTGLLLERIPLSCQCLKNLAQGLELCPNLQQLSLLHTEIGDDGCASLCHVLRRRLNLVWLNLTGCGLTENGVRVLCNLLKFQKLNRYGESWKQSLRYRPVNPNIMPGLRRLTLNFNDIRDIGVSIFVDTIVDDLWLKALDLQHCGITMVGGEALLNLVKENKFLSVVDIRGNLEVPKSLVAGIVQQLALNNGDSIPEFQWLDEDCVKGPSCSSSRGALSIGRSSQRLSSATLPNKGASLLSVLPCKMKAPQYHPRAKSSASIKRITISANNTPRPPWNAGNALLRRGTSENSMSTIKKQQDVLLELQSVKDQLDEVLKKLEEETDRRKKLEEELDGYKRIIHFSDNTCQESVDASALQNICYQFYHNYLTKDSADKPKTASVPKNKTNVQEHESLESVIRTINGENPLNLDVENITSCPDYQDQTSVKQINSSTKTMSETSVGRSDSCSSDDQTRTEEKPSRAHILFQSLLSS